MYVCRTYVWRLASRVCSSQVVRFCGRDAAAAARPYVRHTSALSGDGETYVQENGGLAVGVVLLSEARRRERLRSCGVSLPNAKYIP